MKDIFDISEGFKGSEIEMFGSVFGDYRGIVVGWRSDDNNLPSYYKFYCIFSKEMLVVPCIYILTYFILCTYNF
jgi:hypothetical protein